MQDAEGGASTGRETTPKRRRTRPGSQTDKPEVGTNEPEAATDPPEGAADQPEGATDAGSSGAATGTWSTQYHAELLKSTEFGYYSGTPRVRPAYCCVLSYRVARAISIPGTAG